MNENAGMNFDAVVASREWREQTSRMLDAMDAPARLAYLAELRAKLPAKRRTLQADPTERTVLREDPGGYGPQSTP